MSLLIFLLVGCSMEDVGSKTEFDSKNKDGSNNTNIEVNNSNDKNLNDEKEITIAIWSPHRTWLEINFPIMKYNEEFEKETDIKVKFDLIEGKSYEEFIKKLNTKLYLNKGPTLIYLEEMPYKIYKDSGVALNLKGKVTNLDNIYDAVKDKDGYFVPIGMTVDSININKEEFGYLNLKEPNYTWGWNDYVEIRDKWFEKNNVNLKVPFIKEIYLPVIERLNFFDRKNNEVIVNTDEVTETIKYLRNEFFGGKYNLLNQFKGEDYYKAIFTTEQMNPEYYKITGGTPMNYIFKGRNNILYPSQTHKEVRANRMVLPNVKYKNRSIFIGGFLVNRNGANIEKGVKYLNKIISEKAQMKLYKSGRKFYPVNKNIEDEIMAMEKKEDLYKETLELKQYGLKRIKEGKNKPNILYRDQDMSMFILNGKLYEDIFKIVFADKEYSDEKLKRELQQLENKYTIWMNE